SGRPPAAAHGSSGRRGPASAGSPRDRTCPSRSWAAGAGRAGRRPRIARPRPAATPGTARAGRTGAGPAPPGPARTRSGSWRCTGSAGTSAAVTSRERQLVARAPRQRGGLRLADLGGARALHVRLCLLDLGGQRVDGRPHVVERLDLELVDHVHG